MIPADRIATLARETAMKIDFDMPTSAAIALIEAFGRQVEAETRAQIQKERAQP